MLNQQKKTILFLYFELSGYVVACMEHLVKNHGVVLHVVKYPVNSAAPFNFNISADIHLYDREKFDNKALVAFANQINPDLIYVCGWADKGYLKICRTMKNRIPIVMTLDNPWRGTIKQYIACCLAPIFLKKLFSHVWVPGEPNAKYARNLGFDKDRIMLGMYSADVPLFNNFYKENYQKKTEKFPHRFIFLGRYVELKGIHELWESFQQLTTEERKDWELWCVGKGDSDIKFPDHPAIKDFGFVQPEALNKILSETGVFVFPTHYEHWGVVVHEFASAGFPMLSTASTSAATTFLKEGVNGYFCTAKDTLDLKNKLIKIIELSDQKLNEMSVESHKIGQYITPETWSNTLLQLINSPS